MAKNSKVYRIDLFPEGVANFHRNTGLRSHFYVTEASKRRVRLVATNYTNHRDSVGTLRIVCLGD